MSQFATVTPRRRGKNWRRFFPLYLALSPFFFAFLAFGVYPLFFAIWLALHRWDGVGTMQWVGLDQFKLLLDDPVFFQAIGNTFIIWLLSMVPQLILAMCIALLLNSAVRFSTTYRIAFFIPSITSLVAVTIIFGSIFGTDFGIINFLLETLGFEKIAWLSSPLGIQIAVATTVIWQYTGYNALLYLAGLQTIPAELIEAARVDGANAWQTFWKVRLPQLQPIILFTVMMSTISGLQIFAQPQLLLGEEGGVGRAGMTVSLYLYQQAFSFRNFGYAATIGWGLVVIVLVMVLINSRLVRRRGDD